MLPWPTRARINPWVVSSTETETFAARAAANGLWVSMYVARPNLRADWSPAWPPLLPSQRVAIAVEMTDSSLLLFPTPRRVAWKVSSGQQHRLIAAGEVLVSETRNGPVVAIHPLAPARMRAVGVGAEFAVSWHADPIISLSRYDPDEWMAWPKLG